MQFLFHHAWKSSFRITNIFCFKHTNQYFWDIQWQDLSGVVNPNYHPLHYSECQTSLYVCFLTRSETTKFYFEGAKRNLIPLSSFLWFSNRKEGRVYQAGSSSSWLKPKSLSWAGSARLGEKLKIWALLGLGLKMIWDIWAQKEMVFTSWVQLGLGRKWTFQAWPSWTLFGSI